MRLPTLPYKMCYPAPPAIPHSDQGVSSYAKAGVSNLTLGPQPDCGDDGIGFTLADFRSCAARLGSIKTASFPASRNDTRSSGSFGMRPTNSPLARFAARNSSRNGNATGKSICLNATTPIGLTSPRASNSEGCPEERQKSNRSNSASSAIAIQGAAAGSRVNAGGAPYCHGHQPSPVWAKKGLWVHATAEITNNAAARDLLEERHAREQAGAVRDCRRGRRRHDRQPAGQHAVTGGARGHCRECRAWAFPPSLSQ